ncbi:MAG TPA: hypothetical protein VM802_05065 [Chitinophaga sp.]|uniref:hypothetical protein n=1 Tax=Chitinophaga sp. TaxID=1869181 RepID=UPI002C175284|nr:hypothetical protein [Chitinophaga sp.]HVI44212.1 hypothetical protein [Chitinophaga sp.]
MRLQNILIIALIAGCSSCQYFRDSINDTLHGTPSEKSKGKDGAEEVAESSFSIDTSFTVSSTTVIRHSQNGATVISSSKSKRKEDFLYNIVALQAANTALLILPAYIGKQIYIYDGIHFYNDGRISVKLQHPENPEYVDEYKFRDGEWGEPMPVQLSVKEDVKKSLVPLDELNFVYVANVYRNYTAKAATIDGAAPLDHIYAVVRDGRFIWYPRTISGSRMKYGINFNANGSIRDFVRE